MTPVVTNTLTSSRSLGTSLVNNLRPMNKTNPQIIMFQIPSNANSASTLSIIQIGLVAGLVASIWGPTL
jgi:hypothetical protein